MSFWQIIVETNTFNFAILLLIFAVLYKKLNVSKIIDNLKQSIITRIENAKAEKLSAELKLQNAQKSIENINEEIEDMISDAKQKAAGLSSGIKDNAAKKLGNIEENLVKTISADEKYIAQKATSNTVYKSVQLAKKHIVNVLNNQPELHNKFIEEFLKEI